MCSIARAYCAPALVFKRVRRSILQGLRVAQAAVTERWPKKAEKTDENIVFSIHLLFMQKYWGKQIFAHGRFPEVGQKQTSAGAQ